jgi:hypothetical protein
MSKKEIIHLNEYSIEILEAINEVAPEIRIFKLATVLANIDKRKDWYKEQSKQYNNREEQTNLGRQLREAWIFTNHRVSIIHNMFDAFKIKRFSEPRTLFELFCDIQNEKTVELRYNHFKLFQTEPLTKNKISKMLNDNGVFAIGNCKKLGNLNKSVLLDKLNESYIVVG